MKNKKRQLTDPFEVLDYEIFDEVLKRNCCKLLIQLLIQFSVILP